MELFDSVDEIYKYEIGVIHNELISKLSQIEAAASEKVRIIAEAFDIIETLWNEHNRHLISRWNTEW